MDLRPEHVPLAEPVLHRAEYCLTTGLGTAGVLGVTVVCTDEHVVGEAALLDVSGSVLYQSAVDPIDGTDDTVVASVVGASHA